MKYVYVILVASVGMLAACSRLNEFDPDKNTHLDEGELVEQVIFEVPTLRSLGEDGGTRASLSQDDEGIHFAWEATDTVGIYPNQGAQVYFSMAEGVGTNTASFNGGGWALKENSVYTCYYPFVGNIYLDRDAIPVSFTGQEQAGVSTYTGVRYYLASGGTSSSSGSLLFTFQILNTVIRIRPVGLPAGTYTKASITTDEDLFVQKGKFGLEDRTIVGKTYSNSLEIALKDFTLTEASSDSNPVLIYLTSAPVDLSGKTLTIKIFASDGSAYKYEMTSNKNYEAGAWSGMRCEMEKESSIIYTSLDNQIVTPTNPDAFGATIVSNVYDGTRGILTFETNVMEIGENAFKDCETLTGITIPESVESIGDSAFSGCTNLGAGNTSANMTRVFRAPAPFRSGEPSIVIPDGVKSIGKYAFQNCTSLTSITIPDSVKSIGEGAFQGCINLSSIDIPEESVTVIGANAFDGCASLTSVTIPDGVTSIDAYAFAGCDHLTEVVIPGTVTSIGQYAFENCENLVSITIPNGVTRIEDFTFAGCISLPRINIPDGVTFIGDSAFESCHVLANVSLPGDLEHLGTYAFASCQAFTTFTIPQSITQISSGLLWNCDHLSNVSIHDGVESIGDSAFSECSALTKITIPDSVTTIGGSAFMESGLTSITIPESVTSIGEQAFYLCSGLTHITVHAVNPPSNVTEFTFEDTNNCLIYVPSEKLNAYKTAEGWSNFASRICDHVYVEMGNGMKWATTNVGAVGPDDLGDYFAWGRTEPIMVLDDNYGYGAPFIDTASEIWGGSWRMPTSEEWNALIDKDNFTWTWDSARKGYVVESNVPGFVGNKIFLPAAGDIGEQGIAYVGTDGNYWSSTIFPDDPNSAEFLWFNQDVIYMSGSGRSGGLSVRPVFESTPLGNMENPDDTGHEISLDD